MLSAYPVLSQTFVRNEIQALRQTGVHVTVLALRPGDNVSGDSGWSGPHQVAGPTSVICSLMAICWWARKYPLRLVRLFGLAIRLRGRGLKIAFLHLLAPLRPIAASGVDVVHTHFGWRASGPCLYTAALLGAPSSITLHANDIYVPSADLQRKLYLFDRVVTVCNYNVSVIKKLAPALPSVHVVPCGVDVPEEDPQPVSGARVLSVGRMVPKKGFMELVEAFEMASHTCPGLSLEIIGDGPGRQALEERVKKSPVHRSIRLSGAQPNWAVLEAMSSCSVFALACRRDADGDSDALPVVIREAMARGRPVVSTDVAGIPEALDEVGWIAPSGDVPALAIALLASVAGDGEPQRRGAAARQKVARSATLVHTAAGMLNVFGFTPAPPRHLPDGEDAG
ncbi:glycosyltransferase [Modestobacter sp. VKM Ac-2979]|uniref:glycosyltransferase n=1 Tax=unclassified Modestobacter TaxID=2643866 RepID=UPI0022AB6F5C|nr:MULTISPECIES: glycosyltransferase [unclassified Modestobacter]MCZ2813416.1 glycosyltransferase [Modestobacter sp. VKM Ac-2979]MCZ2842392.1 glycosyltransferase [Modestobacter sp. VKM Ac-2980]